MTNGRHVIVQKINTKIKFIDGCKMKFQKTMNLLWWTLEIYNNQ